MNSMMFDATSYLESKMLVKAWEDWFESEGLVGRHVFRIDFADERHGLVRCYKTRNGSRYCTEDRQVAVEPPFTMEFATPAPVTSIRMFRPGLQVDGDEGG